jgi:hypothetical protein
MAIVIWLIFLAVSFTISIVTLTFVQTRIIQTKGISFFWQPNAYKTFWNQISTIEKWFLCPGIVAFLLTITCALLVALFRKA